MLNYSCLYFNDLSLQQLYALLTLRAEVFVVEQNCPYLDPDGQDTGALHVLGYEDAQLAAYARVYVPEPGVAAIGRVAVGKEFRGRGYGRQLMQAAMDAAAASFNAAVIRISAQRYLERFYESMGFQITSAPYLEDNIPHIGMTRITG